MKHITYRVYGIMTLILFFAAGYTYADYYNQEFVSYYVGEKLTAEDDSMRFYFSIPDSGAVLAGFVMSSDTDWQEYNNESAVCDFCVDDIEFTRQVVITFMGRKKYEYPRYLWELGAGEHYIDIIFNKEKSSPDAEFVRIDSIKIALVKPDNPYFYPCLLMPYLNTYKIYSKDDIPLVVYYQQPENTPVRRYYNNIIFSHDTGHMGQPVANQDYEQFWSDRASSLDVEWYWDVTIDVSDDSLKFIEKYYQGTGHHKRNYSRALRNYHPTIKVGSSNNNFSYGFGIGEEKNRYPQFILPFISSEYHSFYDSHPEIMEIWIKEIRRDYGMYCYAGRHENSPRVFDSGYHHDPDSFEFTDPVYHLFFNYSVSNNTGRNLGFYVKLKDDEKWYGRQVTAGNGEHWQSVVMPDFIDLGTIDSLKITSNGNDGTIINVDLAKIYFFDEDVNYISHKPNFPVDQSIENSTNVLTYAFQNLYSNELTLHKLNTIKETDSVRFQLPLSGDINKNGIVDFFIKETNNSEYSKFSMKRNQGSFSLSLPLQDYSSVYDIMIQAEDQDGVSGYIPQYVEEIDFSTLTSVTKENSLIHGFALQQNYPNPFNPNTTIQYSLAASGPVNLTIYDLLGRQVAVLLDKAQNAGEYQINWNAAQFPSGVYFYRIKAGSDVQMRKMVLVK